VSILKGWKPTVEKGMNSLCNSEKKKTKYGLAKGKQGSCQGRKKKTMGPREKRGEVFPGKGPEGKEATVAGGGGGEGSFAKKKG